MSMASSHWEDEEEEGGGGWLAEDLQVCQWTHLATSLVSGMGQVPCSAGKSTHQRTKVVASFEEPVPLLTTLVSPVHVHEPLGKLAQ